MKFVKSGLASLILLLISYSNGFAQCAMCRATLETNVSNGTEQHLASTLNIGILYLFAAPYLAVATIAFLWYRHNKAGRRTNATG